MEAPSIGVRHPRNRDLRYPRPSEVDFWLVLLSLLPQPALSPKPEAASSPVAREISTLSPLQEAAVISPPGLSAPIPSTLPLGLISLCYGACP